MPDKTRSIFFIQGGAGDVLAHTPTIRYFRNKHPDDEIIVLSTYAQLWEGNPNVDKVIPSKDVEDFYDEYIIGKKVRFFKKHFVYDAIMDEEAVGTKCLPEFICKVYGAEYDGKPLDYFVSVKEKRNAATFMGQYKAFNKPIVLLQCTGAIPSDGNFNKTNRLKDLDVKMVSALVKKHAENIIFIQIGLIGEPIVEGAIDALGQPMREAIACIEYASSFIFIESLFAHCSNALNKSGVVVFQNTSPDYFGYTNNHNISFSGGCDLWPCNRPVGALIDLMPGYRNPKTREKLLWECPDQKCARMPVEQLESVLLESLKLPVQSAPVQGLSVVKGNPALEAARNQYSPQEIEQAVRKHGIATNPANAQVGNTPYFEAVREIKMHDHALSPIEIEAEFIENQPIIDLPSKGENHGRH